MSEPVALQVAVATPANMREFDGAIAAIDKAWSGTNLLRRVTEGRREEVATAFSSLEKTRICSLVADIGNLSMSVASAGGTSGIAASAERLAKLSSLYFEAVVGDWLAGLDRSLPVHGRPASLLATMRAWVQDGGVAVGGGVTDAAKIAAILEGGGGARLALLAAPLASVASCDIVLRDRGAVPQPADTPQSFPEGMASVDA